MAYNLEEQETIDKFKTWWDEYGNTVLGALILFFAGVAGIQGWRWYQNSQAEQAAQLYAEVEKALTARDVQKAKAAATQVMEKFSGTAYAPRAALAVARTDYEAGDMAGAKAQLRWTIDNTKEDELRDVARLRLAGVFLDEKNYEEAIKTLEGAHTAYYAALFSDLKGDVLVGQGKTAEAKGAYQAALEKMDPGSPYRGFIELKLESLGG